MSSIKPLKKALLVTILGSVFASSFAIAADSQWLKKHPRRAEVNARLANQNRRIHQQVKEGDLTRAEAAQLHQEHRAIRQEERSMASMNGGHITKTEQRALNQQENAVSRQIGR